MQNSITYNSCKCDQCKKVLCDEEKEIDEEYLYFRFSGYSSGWAKGVSNAKFMPSLVNINLHFCGYKCFREYLDKLKVDYQKEKLKE